jgi:hypothetical protein
VNTSYIRNRIKRYFPREQVDDVFALLREYDEKPRPDFTYYAILRLSRGDKESLRAWVQRAQQDSEMVIRAGANYETWEHVVDSYRRDSERGPYLLPLLRLTERIHASEYATLLRAGRSHGSLRIYVNEDDPFGSQVLVSPSANGLRVHRSEVEDLSASPILDSSDPYEALVPWLKALISTRHEFDS